MGSDKKLEVSRKVFRFKPLCVAAEAYILFRFCKILIKSLGESGKCSASCSTSPNIRLSSIAESDPDFSFQIQIFEYCRSLRVHARIIPENKNIIMLLENRLRAAGVTGVEFLQLSRPQAVNFLLFQNSTFG